MGLDNKGCFFIFLDFMRVFRLLILDSELDMKIKKAQNGNRKRNSLTIRTPVSKSISVPKGLAY